MIAVDFAKKHWKALRDDFFRRNKKLQNNEVSREKVLKWPLFTTLEFLRAHYKRWVVDFIWIMFGLPYFPNPEHEI